MISAGQLRAARALLNIDQRDLAELSDLSVPTIQRMEASESTLPRITPSLASMRWMVGTERPDSSASSR